jgi:hypothetical protein
MSIRRNGRNKIQNLALKTQYFIFRTLNFSLLENAPLWREVACGFQTQFAESISCARRSQTTLKTSTKIFVIIFRNKLKRKRNEEK